MRILIFLTKEDSVNIRITPYTGIKQKNKSRLLDINRSDVKLDMKFENKFLLMMSPIIFILIIIVIGSMIYYQASKLPQQLRAEIHSEYLESKKKDLIGYINLAENAIKHLRDPELQFSTESAKKEAKRILTNLKYSAEDGYFFVYDFSGRNIVHPIKKDWVGRDKWNYQDDNGKYVIRDLINTARCGDGFDEYIFHKPSLIGATEGKLKLAYVVELPEWEWIIGTGLYLEDVDIFLNGIDSTVLENTYMAMLWIAGIAFIGILILVLSQHNIGKKLERAKIGMDLHDEVKQDLVYMIREMNNILEDPDQSKPENIRNFLIKIKEPAQHALEWIRTFIDGKDPNTFTLIVGLTKLRKNFEAKENMLVNLVLDDQIEAIAANLSKEKILTLLKVANEALNNIGKHTKCTQIDIYLTIAACNIVLSIRDNGSGFDVDQVKSTYMGLGLRSMEDRTRRVGGVLTIASSHQGTEIIAIIPRNHNIWTYLQCRLKR